MNIGEEVLHLLGKANYYVLIAAPFVKRSSLASLLDGIPNEIQVDIVTQWRPIDFAFGVSDLAVFELALERNASLFLRDKLHAKLFVADEMCLVGSANVTHAALGWSDSANLELLVPVSRNNVRIQQFEEELKTNLVEVTPEIKEIFSTLVEKIRNLPDMNPVREIDIATDYSLPMDWYTLIRNPEELFLVYLDSGEFDTSYGIGQEMFIELTKFSIPPGLDAVGFNAWIASAIVKTPLVNHVIRLLEEQKEISEEEFSKLLSKVNIHHDQVDSSDVMEALKRWLKYFLGYRVKVKTDKVKLSVF